MFLIFDTETTGFPLWNQPHDNKYQARVVQIGMLLFDEQFREIASFSSLVRPEGWDVIDPGAHAKHGITVEACQKHGMPVSLILENLEYFMVKARHAVAFNLKFDSFMLDIELKLKGKSGYRWEDDGVCAMIAMTEICKIPYKTKRVGYKWPKLEEAYKFITGEEPPETHDALADCRSTAVVFGYLLQNKLINLEEFQVNADT